MGHSKHQTNTMNSEAAVRTALVGETQERRRNQMPVWFQRTVMTALLIVALASPVDAFVKPQASLRGASSLGRSRKPLHRMGSVANALPEAQRIYQEPEDAMMLLDLDKTAIFGNDGNDFGLALQWMEKPKDSLDQLYRTLVNPQLRPAFDKMKSRTEKLDLAIYTRRPALLSYSSCFRDCVIPLSYKKMNPDDGQLYIPGDVQSASEMWKSYCGPSLLPEEENDVRMCLDRLFSARDALTASLGLEKPPTIVVTDREKNVRATAQRLGQNPDRAFLFDDNRALQYASQVVSVEPLESLPSEQRSKLLQFLERELPVQEMEASLVEFLMGAPPTDCAIERDPASLQWRWRVPLAARGLPSWQVPGLAQPMALRTAGCHQRGGAVQVSIVQGARAEGERMVVV